MKIGFASLWKMEMNSNVTGITPWFWGFTTCPFILKYILKYHIEHYQLDEYTEILKNNFYVDNLHQTNNHTEEMIKF